MLFDDFDSSLINEWAIEEAALAASPVTSSKSLPGRLRQQPMGSEYIKWLLTEQKENVLGLGGRFAVASTWGSALDLTSVASAGSLRQE